MTPPHAPTLADLLLELRIVVAKGSTQDMAQREVGALFADNICDLQHVNGYDIRRVASPAAPPPSDLGLRLAKHLCALQSENGGDEIGQETNDLMFAVMKQFGLRTKLVQHDPVPACGVAGLHNVVECGREDVLWEFEPTPPTPCNALAPNNVRTCVLPAGHSGEHATEPIASSRCPWCGIDTPHHHDRCTSCDAPATLVDITEGRCPCPKDENGMTIHGLVSYDLCKARGWDYGICWSCHKRMPSKKWVHLRPVQVGAGSPQTPEPR